MDVLNVKVGDEVIYNGGGYFSEDKITKVVKVTPTGRIRVEYDKNIQFDKYGYEIGSRAFNRSKIRKCTEEDKKEIIERDTIKECISLLNRSEKYLNYEKALRIIDILKGE